MTVQTAIVATVGGLILGVNLALVALAATALWCGVPWRRLPAAARWAGRVLAELRLPASSRTTLPIRIPAVKR